MPIFCWAMMVSGSYEEDQAPLLMQHVLAQCDACALYSNVTLHVRFAGSADGLDTTKVYNGSLHAPRGGPFRTALNTAQFIAAYRYMVVEEQRHMRHRWIVKVEPDSVVVVPRLRTLLSKIDPSVPLVLAGKPGPFWDGHLEGAIIPLSSAGLAQYARRREKCERNHTFRDGKSEDWYLGLCANEIGVRSLFIPLMVYASLAATDLLDVCTRPFVAFHGAALKNGDGYHMCAQLAHTAEESPPCTDVWPHCAAHNKRGCAGAARLVQRSARLLRTAATMCAQCQPFDNDANWWLSHCRRTCGLCAPNTARHVPVDRQLHHATKHRRRHSDASSVALRKEGAAMVGRGVP